MLTGRLDDDALVAAARSVDVVGVDSPLGWPVAFVDAVGAHDIMRAWLAVSTDRRSPTATLIEHFASAVSALQRTCPLITK